MPNQAWRRPRMPESLRCRPRDRPGLPARVPHDLFQRQARPPRACRSADSHRGCEFRVRGVILNGWRRRYLPPAPKQLVSQAQKGPHWSIPSSAVARPFLTGSSRRGRPWTWLHRVRQLQGVLREAVRGVGWMGSRLRREVPCLALTQQEAAASLGVSVDHFERHIKPQLPVVLVGSKRIYPHKGLERWLDENTLVGGRRPG